MTRSICSGRTPCWASCSGRRRSPSKAKMSRCLASHLSPAPVSIKIHFPAERISREFIARRMRLRSSGGALRSQKRPGDDAEHRAAIETKVAVGQQIEFEVAEFHRLLPRRLIALEPSG